MVEVRAHDFQADSTGSVGALMLREVVAPGELLAAVSALERLVVSVERAVVTLEVFLTAEAAGAERADECLGWVVGEGLLAAATAGGSDGSGVLVRAGADGVLGLTLVVRLGLAKDGAGLLDDLPLGCGHVVKLAGGRGERQAVDKLLLKVGEALVAQEVVLRREGTEVSALALVTEELSVVGGEVDEAVEVVLAVKLKQGLKGGETVEVESLDRFEVVDLGGLTLENNLVLLVTRAEGDNGKFRSNRDGKIAGVAEVVLSLGNGGAGKR
jgi:hypothetical protein